MFTVLENECKDLKEKINYLEDKTNNIYKDEINIVYNTEKEGECRIFGDKFVEINMNTIKVRLGPNYCNLIL